MADPTQPEQDKIARTTHRQIVANHVRDVQKALWVSDKLRDALVALDQDAQALIEAAEAEFEDVHPNPPGGGV